MSTNRSLHHGETAAQHMVRRVPTAAAGDTAAEVVERLSGSSFDYAGAVYIVDHATRLKGIVPLTRLLAADPGTPLEALAQAKLPAVTPGTDQELVASLAIHEETAAVPVVDDQLRLLGVVPPLALLEVLRREHVEDLHRLAGISRESSRARHAIEAPPTRRARDRLPWLLVGLAGSVLATMVVAYFEQALQSRVTVAFFIPGIVYLADAIGTQTEAIAVRGISLSRLSVARLISGEIITGLIIGSTLAALSFFPIWWWFEDIDLATAVSVALFVAGTVATTIGVLFPWILSRLGRDPAFGSGPLGTIVQDVLSLVIYFVTISALVL
ncbi:MAG: magnesium transporter [Betaproteobacteria bacterium]|nr:magnesium transporter [Betaproteobacteria bacterium]